MEEQKKGNNEEEWWECAWVKIIILIVICVMPIIINWVTTFENGSHDYDTPSPWTEIWAEYGGALVSAGIALVILYKQQKQNEKQNEFNRNLQIKALKYQEKYNWYTHLRSEFSNLTCAWDVYFIKDITIKIAEFYINNNINKEAIKEFKSSMEDIINKKLSKLDFLQVSCKYLFPDYDLDDKEKEIWKEIDLIQDHFYNVFYNLRWIINSLPHPNSKEGKMHIEDIKELINKECKNTEYEIIHIILMRLEYDFYNHSYEVIFSIFKIFEEATKERAFPVFKLLQYEQKKIDKLLDVEEIKKNLNAN